MMKFEDLPNEIFVECFEYLNGIDIFYSFNRFKQLIRNSPLHLNFQHMNKPTFNRLCSTIFFNPDIKLRIISLQLFNTIENDQIKKFIYCFPLHRFSHLHSLTLIGLDSDHIESISSMLLLSTNLSHFAFSTLKDDDSRKIISTIQISKINSLLMSSLTYDFDFTPEMTIITNLAISDCNLIYLHQLLKYTPMLKCLHIKCIIAEYCDEDKLIYDDFKVTYLKQLIIQEYTDTFKRLEILLKKTSNLKIFTLVTTIFIMEMIDADYWQYLITTSLPCLNDFDFKFLVKFYENYDFLLHQFQKSQTDFWYKQHHWYSIHEFHAGSTIIYTVPIPYVLNEYKLTFQTAKSSNLLINKLKIFDNVTDLIVEPIKYQMIFNIIFQM